MTRRLVLATRNEHKVHELRQILAGLVDELGLEVVGADDVEGAPDVAETEVTFLGNARLKAVALAAGHRAARGRGRLRAGGRRARRLARGLLRPLVGVDGGGGCRRAERDRANLDLLLEQIGDVPDEHRAAAFVCAAVVALPDGRVEGVEGRVTGRLVAGAARHERLRLRPRLRARRRHPHPRRVHRRREERDLAPGQRLPRPRAGAARPAWPELGRAEVLGWSRARVAELADAPGLGPGAFGCAGSSPASRSRVITGPG